MLNLDSNQYGSIVGKVDFGNDKLEVAKILAQALGTKFTANYVATACQMVDSEYRPDIVKVTAEYITDLKQNHMLIDNSLSDFEKMIVSGALDQAMK